MKAAKRRTLIRHFGSKWIAPPLEESVRAEAAATDRLLHAAEGGVIATEKKLKEIPAHITSLHERSWALVERYYNSRGATLEGWEIVKGLLELVSEGMDLHKPESDHLNKMIGSYRELLGAVRAQLSWYQQNAEIPATDARRQAAEAARLARSQHKAAKDSELRATIHRLRRQRGMSNRAIAKHLGIGRERLKRLDRLKLVRH